MTRTIEKLEASAQLDRAAAAVSEALARAQGDAATDADRTPLAGSLAACLQRIYAIKTEGLLAAESLSNIRGAMSRLRAAMTELQNTRSQTPAALDSLRMTAKTLALLYPVSTLIEQLSTERLSRPSSRPSAPPNGDSEHGRDRRTTLRQTVEVDIGLHADTNFFTGFSEDISAGGLFVSTYNVLPIGTKVNVNFSLPAGPILSINGTVRWIREHNDFSADTMPGMGIQFDSLADEEADLINRYMSEIPPMFYD